MENNPYLKQANPFIGYNKSVEDLKNHPEFVQFDKLCYEVFEMSEVGKKFIEYVRECYLIPSLVENSNPKYDLAVVYAEGFKEAFRLIIRNILSHKQRIKSETNQNA